MISYDKDGVTLFYIDATGKRVSHYFMDGTPYNDMVNIRDAQIQAIRENTQAQANYETALANAQVNVEAGRTVSAPAKPLQKIVADTGEVSYAPFDPPLKDLAAPTGKPAPNSGTIKVDVPDKQAILFNMVLAIFRRMFPEV